MKKLVAAWFCIITLLLISCSPENDTVAIIPTVAVLPSLTNAITANNSPVPTFTTTASSTPKYAVIATLKPTFQVSLLPTFTLIPPVATSTPNWLDVESRVINKVLPISDGATQSNYISIAGDDNYLKFFYEYRGDSITNAMYLAKIPYLLCELRATGLKDLTIEANISFKSSRGKDLGGDYLCIAPTAFNQLNCEDPSRTNLNRIRNGGKCDL